MFDKGHLQAIREGRAGIVPADHIYLSDGQFGNEVTRKDAFISIEAGDKAEDAIQALNTAPEPYNFHTSPHGGKIFIYSIG